MIFYYLYGSNLTIRIKTHDQQGLKQNLYDLYVREKSTATVQTLQSLKDLSNNFKKPKTNPMFKFYISNVLKINRK